MNFMHIVPTPHLDLVKGRKHHLTLAHLIEENEEYTEFYRNESELGAEIIMDNSAFEMYKQGRPMYDSDKLIEMGERIDADYIALSDYPDENSMKTITAAVQYAPKFQEAGFGTFFIPQSKIGDLDDLMMAYMWAVNSDLVDYIGFSILAIPNAYDVEKGNKLQRFASRTMFCELLDRVGFWEAAVKNKKKIHFLGMVDGPNEIFYSKKWPVHTWDSSAGAWAGLNDIIFDGSPTGMLNGKFEKEVDFNFKTTDKELINKAIDNMGYIDEIANPLQVQ